MDPTSSVFIVLIIAMGGGIAYLADIVGKKLGKKRLSVFGLRPRQTAALGTALVGVLISIATIAVALAVSSPLRLALLHGRQTRQELERVESELKKQETELKNRANANSVLSKQNGALTATIKDRQEKLKDAQTRLTSLNSKIDSLQSKIASVNGQLAARESAYRKLQDKLRTTNSTLSTVAAELRASTSKLTYLRADYKSTEDQDAMLVTQIDKLNADKAKLEADKANLVAELKKIEQDVDNLRIAQETAQADLENSQAAVKDAKDQLAAAKAELADTRAQLDEAKLDFERYRWITTQSRNQPMIYRMNEEVARLKVSDKRSVRAATDDLNRLLRMARVAAQHRGASGSRDYPEAVIVSHSDPRTHETITPEMIEQNIVHQIVSSSEPEVLIAVSSLNAFRGESVSLEVMVLPDPLVYSKGQLIAETQVEPAGGDAAVYQQITTFLQEKVRDAAQKDGMIPVSNSDISFGQISSADLLQLIDQLRKADQRTIRLEARAAQNTRAADELKLDFRLR